MNYYLTLSSTMFGTNYISTNTSYYSQILLNTGCLLCKALNFYDLLPGSRLSMGERFEIRVELAHANFVQRVNLCLRDGNTELEDKVVQVVSGAHIVILLDAVAHVVQNNQAVLALHLSDGELLVHSLAFCQYE